MCLHAKCTLAKHKIDVLAFDNASGIAISTAMESLHKHSLDLSL